MFAQEYPTKPVRMIEPFGAGGGVDVIARILSPRLSETWGQPVTVENHPGLEARRLLPLSQNRQPTVTHYS